MPCLFQSTTQKEELPRFVSEDSTQRNTVSFLPHSSVDVPCLLELDDFTGFPGCFSSSPKRSFGETLKQPTQLHFGSLSSGSTHSSSQKTTKSCDRGFFFFWPHWHLIPFHSGMQPRQNNHLMGVESDYHCSVLSPMSAENIVQQQQQQQLLLASVMPGQERSRRGGDTTTQGGEKKQLAVLYGMCACVSHTKDACTVSRFAWISN